jgi:hypothetical protein
MKTRLELADLTIYTQGYKYGLFGLPLDNTLILGATRISA